MSNIPHGKRLLRRAAAGAALLVVTACAVGLWHAGSRRHSNPLSRAARAYAEGRWAAAAELVRQVLSSRKDDATALRLLARSSVRLGRDDAAIAIYTRRLEEKAMEAEDYLLLGLAHQRRRQEDAAVHAWNKVLEAPRLSPKLLEELARLHLQGHRSEDAIRVAELLSRQLGWEARGSMMLGTVRAALRDVPGAADSFRRAMNLDPEEVDKSGDPTKLRKLIARTFLQAGQPALARVVLKPIMARGRDPEAAWLLSRAYLQEGDKAQAAAALVEAGSYRADNPLEAEPSPYVGEARCEKCHAAIFRDSLASRHTQSYYRGAQLDQLPLADRPLPDPDDPEVTHTIRKRDGTLWEETRVGKEVDRAVIEYAFGTSDRYLTLVSRDARGGYRIARLSYYDTPEGRGWDRSILDTSYPSRGRAQEFQGQEIGVRDGLARCLYCHLTNPRTGREPIGPETADRAIGCERCHGPGGNHLAALQAGFRDPAIVNPALASPAAATTKQCNDCHILDRNFPKGDPDNPGWVRSQGVGWTLSRCNTESDGAFGCVTCHDPHKSARATTTAQYEVKCLTCHGRAVQSERNAGVGSTPLPRAKTQARICPVDSSKGCIPCHMPRVRIDPLHLDLTDHYIRLDRRKR
jgi:predicted CXXCH cytochrome family protein